MKIREDSVVRLMGEFLVCANNLCFISFCHWTNLCWNNLTPNKCEKLMMQEFVLVSWCLICRKYNEAKQSAIFYQMAKRCFVDLSKTGGIGNWLEKPKCHESFTVSESVLKSFDIKWICLFCFMYKCKFWLLPLSFYIWNLCRFISQ